MQKVVDPHIYALSWHPADPWDFQGWLGGVGLGACEFGCSWNKWRCLYVDSCALWSNLSGLGKGCWLGQMYIPCNRATGFSWSSIHISSLSSAHPPPVSSLSGKNMSCDLYETHKMHPSESEIQETSAEMNNLITQVEPASFHEKNDTTISILSLESLNIHVRYIFSVFHFILIHREKETGQIKKPRLWGAESFICGDSAIFTPSLSTVSSMHFFRYLHYIASWIQWKKKEKHLFLSLFHHYFALWFFLETRSMQHEHFNLI